jgi:hypothetical protein
MPYTNSDNIKAWLKGYTIDFTTVYADLSIFIQAAEAEVNGICSRKFGLTRYTELVSGLSDNVLMTMRSPVVGIDRLAVMYGNIITRVMNDGTNEIAVDRKIGRITLTALQELVGGYVIADNFPRGEQNIQIVYQTGEAMVGDNVGFAEVARLGFNNVMSGAVSGSNFVFTLPFAIGKVGWKVLKSSNYFADYTDNTASWTLSAAKDSISILNSNYESAKYYRLVYIPTEVESAATILAAGKLLQSIGGKDTCEGGGGVQSISVGGFSESYGDGGKWGGQIKQWNVIAMQMLKSFKAIGISNV